MRLGLAPLLALAALCLLARAEPEAAEEDEETAAMQTVARLREAACASAPPGGGPHAAGGPAESEEMAVMQTARRLRMEAQHEAAPAHSAAPGREEAAGGRARGSRYLPSVHEKAVEEAFNAVIAEGGHLVEILQRYRQAGMQKKTHGTCKLGSCDASHGKTDCLGKVCLCQDGYGTQDGVTCVERYALPLVNHDADSGGTCAVFMCHKFHGPTRCLHGKCICEDGYVAEEGRCVTPSHADPAKDVVHTMLLAGVREPDELPCPGDTFEEGTMNNAVLKMALGSEHFNLSLCRTAAQIYHASPLPMVRKRDLHEPPSENGYLEADNALKQLYSVVTMRQWRSHMVKIMATEFVYAVAMPDLAEGAKRLGNLFHTLSDAFSASHVKRHASEAKEATPESCGALTVKLPMSMDVMNFVVHPFADCKDDDLLFRCSSFYEAAGIRLWAEARLQGVASVDAANAWVERAVNEVFCPALPVPADSLDHPAGGASTTYSAHLNKPALPKGTASESDAKRIIEGWAQGLAAARAKEKKSVQRAYPHGLVVPPRSEDVCASAALARVEARHFEAARDSQLPPQYLQPYF